MTTHPVRGDVIKSLVTSLCGALRGFVLAEGAGTEEGRLAVQTFFAAAVASSLTMAGQAQNEVLLRRIAKDFELQVKEMLGREPPDQARGA
jgi:hypothetical protein